MSKSVDEQIRKVALLRTSGSAPAGHAQDCRCDDCLKHEARVLDEIDRIAERVVAGVREDKQADQEFEQYKNRAVRISTKPAKKVAAAGPLVQRKLQMVIDGHLRRAGELVEQAGDGRMSGDQYRHFTRASTRAAEVAKHPAWSCRASRPAPSRSPQRRAFTGRGPPTPSFTTCSCVPTSTRR